MSQPALLPYDPSAFKTAAAIFLCCLSPSHIRSKMASGAKVANSVKELYTSMKVVKQDADQNERIRLVVFGFDNGNIVETDIYKEKDLVGKDVFMFFRSLMEKGECRYILYDCHFETKESSKKEELIFVLWCSEDAKIKNKMNYASSKDALTKNFSGIKHKWQFTDIADLDRDTFAEKLGNVANLEGSPVHH